MPLQGAASAHVCLSPCLSLPRLCHGAATECLPHMWCMAVLPSCCTVLPASPQLGWMPTPWQLRWWQQRQSGYRLTLACLVGAVGPGGSGPQKADPLGGQVGGGGHVDEATGDAHAKRVWSGPDAGEVALQARLEPERGNWVQNVQSFTWSWGGGLWPKGLCQKIKKKEPDRSDPEEQSECSCTVCLCLLLLSVFLRLPGSFRPWRACA